MDKTSNDNNHSNYTLLDIPNHCELRKLAGQRDELLLELRKQISHDSTIADNMRDYWKHLNSGAE